MNLCIICLFAIGLTIQTSTAQDLVLQCPNGWIKLYERCYLIVPYKHTWLRAKDYCDKYGAHLAQPSGYTITDDLSTQTKYKQIHAYWIGFNLLGQTSKYQGYWSDGRETSIDAGVWAPFQPNATYGDCAAIVSDETADHVNRWHMTSCNYVMPFVCERNPCPNDTFTCANGNCVSTLKQCNSVNDCGDESDEQKCEYQCWVKREDPSGVLQITPATHYGTLRYCVFTIQTEIGMRIQVKFETVDLEDGLDILEIWDGGPTLATSSYIGYVSGQSAGQYETYISSTNIIIFVLITDSSLAKEGVTISWSTDFTCKILPKTGFSVMKTTKGYERLLTERQGVSVCTAECQSNTECWGFQFDISLTGLKKCFFITEAPSLTRDNCCDLYVNICPNTARFNAVDELPTHPQHLVAEKLSKDLYTPLYPFMYIGNYEQTHHITVEGNRLITLQVVFVDLCCSDTISIHDGNGPNSEIIALIDKDYPPGYIISSGRDLYIHMNLQQHWECTGVMAKYYAGCDVTMTAESGVVKSPGYGVNMYPGIMKCTWTIQPSSGKSVRLTFVDFELEENMDFLEIYKGIDATNESVHFGFGNTGTNVPATVVSNVGIFLRFSTSAINSYRGFYAEYSVGCPVITRSSLVVEPMLPSYHSPDEVTITCAEGYLFAGSFQGEDVVNLTCQKNGTWNLKNYPFCERQYCGLAPTLEYGYIVYASGVRGGDFIEYACRTGFTLIGNHHVLCYSNSTWGQLPKCMATECPDLSTQGTGATVDFIRGNGREQGTVAVMSCPQYYELIGPKTIICEQGGWQTGIPICIPKPCPVLPVSNGNINQSQSFVKNSTIHVRCNPGYAIGGTDTDMDGYFQCGVDEPLACNNVNECLLGLHECRNATCVDNDGSYQCDCLKGFIPRSDNYMICDDVNECVGRLNLCEHTCVNVPGSYQCGCEPGYNLYTELGLNGHNVLPQEDGTKPWHAFHLNHSCVLKSCKAFEVLALVNGKALTSRKIFFYGDTVEYICNIGYYVTGSTKGSMNTTCNVEGEWTVKPSCEVAYCTDDNIDSVVPSGPIFYEDRYTLKCSLINGQVVLQNQCGYDKDTGIYRTAGPPLVCPEMECGEPPLYTGMNPFIILSYTYNSTIVFECEDQYVRRGQSSLGDYLVPCGKDGTWEYGTLHCEGGQCSDLGYPVNGQTTYSSWQHGTDTMYSVAIGSVATFTCNTPGYVPEPTPNATCRKVGNEAAWDNSVPVCVDRQPPAFVNCPDDMEVERYSSVFYTTPHAIDNTGVNSSLVFPENFNSGSVIDSTLTVTYIAKDFEGNEAWCQFRILVKDDSSPMLICKLPDPITASDSNIRISTDIYLAYDDPSANIVASHEVVTANYEAIGTNPILTFSGTDPAGNLAVCKSQMRIDAPLCEPETLRVYNGAVSCTPTLNGNECTVTCSPGYYFYEDPSLSSIIVTCSDGAEWSRDMPICTAKDLPFFRSTIKYHYQIGPTVLSTCAPTYLADITDQLLTLTNALTSLCDNATNTIDISPSTTNPVSAEIKEIMRKLEVKITMDITPQGLHDNVYRGCTEAILGAFNSINSWVSSVQYLDGGPSCAPINMNLYDAQIDDEVFACTSSAEAVALSENSHICLACPPGTYSNNFRCVECAAGTYNDGFYKNSCKSCPEETSSKKIGAKYYKECYEDCGLHMYSVTGKPPCTDCPRDTYFVNNTYCAPCPSGTFTRGRGAFSIDACIGTCPPGYVSRDGLKPCNLCPRNYYQSKSGLDFCSECPSNMITLTDGSNSSADCKLGYAHRCQSNTCQNDGVCMVIRHDFYCNCTAGFTGRMCETALSPCDVSPCLNGGTCEKVNLTHYTCSCQEPFKGDQCEIDVDHCVGDICRNNGTCIDQKGKYMCACASHSGFHGDKCQYPQEPCLRFPCKNSGQCVPQGSYNRVCKCPQGFSGIDCEINEDECASNPCTNSAACVDGDNMFTCVCPSGYHGLYCHLRDKQAVCDTSACTPETECIDNYVDNTKHCICPEGFYFSNLYHQCVINIEYCDHVDCGNQGTCITYDDGFHTKCHCETGYAGKQCQINVDECVHSPCNNNGTCVDAVAGYTCSCPVPGTGGPNCDDNNDGCHTCVPENTMYCTDELQSYTCYCKPGYFGEDCQHVVPSCEYSPCQHNGSCTNLVSPLIHHCICRHPWTGNNCEEELDICSAQEYCLNGGECISTSDGYVCGCPYNYIGTHCETLYDLCDRANPCVGNNSSCIDTHDGIQCSCEPGYAGDSCETLLWYCADNTCKHGGTCSVVDSVGVVCACSPGYTGMDCSININECDTETCPANADCIDGINEATCVCHDGKVGESCEKDEDTTFDFLIQPLGHCSEQITYPMYTVDKSEFTLRFWGRATVLNDAESFVSLYGVSTSDSPIHDWLYRVQVGGSGVRFDLRQGLDSETIPFTTSIDDGLWHSVTVIWSNGDGYLSVYVDGRNDNEAVFGIGRKLSNHGFIVLGEPNTRVENSFIGRISRVKFHNERLSEEDVISYESGINPSNLISYKTLKNVYRYTYNSQLTTTNCVPGFRCEDKAFNASMLPSIAQCPLDTLYIGERISTPEWDQSTFYQTLPKTRKATAISGETTMGWGSYGVGVAEYTADGAAAVCTFRLYNKRWRCTEPLVPDGMDTDCSTIIGNERNIICDISCKSRSQSPSEESPLYYMCSKYGMWDQEDRDVDYQLPPCSPSFSPKNNLTVQVEYDLIQACGDPNFDLQVEIRERIKQINLDWSYGFCKTEYDEVDTECDVVEMFVVCLNDTTALVDIVFPNLGKTVGITSNSVSPQDAFKISFKDREMITFMSIAEPNYSTFTMNVVKTCSVGYQLIEDNCVLCGNGFFYDVDTAKCTRCPRGTYRTVYPTTHPTSQCTPCEGSDTTTNTGSPAKGYCHESCYHGNYFDPFNGSCEVCSVGFYSGVTGSTSCSPCSIDKTTINQASTNSQQCIPFSEIYTTTMATNIPAVGATTEGELSAGVVAAVVLGVLIFITILLVFIFLCVTNRLPCQKDGKKVGPAGAPMKYVNRYGETNMKYISYRLSDIRDFKKQSLDKIPMYNEHEPVVTEATYPHDGITVQVPVFMEKLDGTVNKKHTFIQSRRNSESLESDFDRTSERPASAINGSVLSGSGRFNNTIKENGAAGSDSNTGSVVMTKPPRKHHRRTRHGRPPTDLSKQPKDVPRTLTPIRSLFQAPKVEQTSEYIRAPSPFGRQRQEVTPAQYEDFLTKPTRSEEVAVTPPASRSGSDKILLESDDEDLR